MYETRLWYKYWNKEDGNFRLVQQRVNTFGKRDATYRRDFLFYDAEFFVYFL